MNDGLNAIRKYFTLETAPRQRTKWLVCCEKCGDMWHLNKTDVKIGSVLQLLNHARGHDAPKKHGPRKQAALDAMNDN